MSCHKRTIISEVNCVLLSIDAITEISASSAPGPDGIQASFWKKCAV